MTCQTRLFSKQPTDCCKGLDAQLAQPGSDRARRLICRSCKAQFYFCCMLSIRTQIVRTQMRQRGQYIHFSQWPKADGDDNHKNPVLDKKNPDVHLPQHLILQWNANGIYRELPLQEDLFEVNNVFVVCIQETKLLPKGMTTELQNFSFETVRRDRPVQGEARGGLMIYIRKYIPYNVSNPQANSSSEM